MQDALIERKPIMLIDYACLQDHSVFYPILLHCRKFGDPRLVLDVAYNLVYSWHVYSSDADCYLFLHMLMGKIATCLCMPVLHLRLLHTFVWRSHSASIPSCPSNL